MNYTVRPRNNIPQTNFTFGSGRKVDSRAAKAERDSFVDPRTLVRPMSPEERADVSRGPRHMIAASWKEFVPGRMLTVPREKAVERRGTFMEVLRLAQKLFPGAKISIKCLEPQPKKDASKESTPPAAAEKAE